MIFINQLFAPCCTALMTPDPDDLGQTKSRIFSNNIQRIQCFTDSVQTRLTAHTEEDCEVSLASINQWWKVTKYIQSSTVIKYNFRVPVHYLRLLTYLFLLLYISITFTREILQFYKESSNNIPISKYSDIQLNIKTVGMPCHISFPPSVSQISFK